MTNFDKKLGEIRERAEKATAGPWILATSCSWRRFVNKIDGHRVIEPTIQSYDNHPDLIVAKEDAEFICTSRTDVPRLVEALEWLINEINDDVFADEIKTEIVDILDGKGKVKG